MRGEKKHIPKGKLSQKALFVVWLLKCFQVLLVNICRCSGIHCFPFSACCFYSLVIHLDRRHYNPTWVTAPSSGVAAFVPMALCECLCLCIWCIYEGPFACLSCLSLQITANAPWPPAGRAHAVYMHTNLYIRTALSPYS